MTPLIPVLLAGGEGKRLAPLSTPEKPKQLQALLHPHRTLLQQTAERALLCAPAENVITLAAERHADEVRRQLAELHPDLARYIICEPESRNTAASAATAALYAAEHFGDAALCLLPADHAISHVDVFARDVRKAAGAAPDRIGAFGIAPEGPDSRFGYMRHSLLPRVHGGFDVEAFYEKPDRATAEALLAAGGCLWNSGIFVAGAACLIEAFERNAPETLTACKTALDQSNNGSGYIRLGDAYAIAPALPVDKAVMERAGNMVVFPAAFDWADIGSPDALAAAQARWNQRAVSL